MPEPPVDQYEKAVARANLVLDDRIQAHRSTLTAFPEDTAIAALCLAMDHGRTWLSRTQLIDCLAVAIHRLVGREKNE